MNRSTNKLFEKFGLNRHPNARTLLATASSEFNIIQPQFYFPGFDVIAADNNFIYSPDTILNNKYKLVNIDYLLDKQLDNAQSTLEAMPNSDIENDNNLLEELYNDTELKEIIINNPSVGSDSETEIPGQTPGDEHNSSKLSNVDNTSITGFQGQCLGTNKKGGAVLETPINEDDTVNTGLETGFLGTDDNGGLALSVIDTQILSRAELGSLKQSSIRPPVVSLEFSVDDTASNSDWTDCSSETNSQRDDGECNESVMSEYDLLANNNLDIPDEDFTERQLEDNRNIAEQAKFFEQVRPADKKDNTDNCFSLMATIQKTHNGNVKTYHQKIFCKKAPLIEPLKAIDQTNYPDLLTNAKQGTLNNTLLPDPNTKKIFDKLNSIHNTSHVETLSLYTLSKLTELGKCPTFPYYFGSLQGIMPVHYHNITDEIQDYTEYDWFNELIELGLIDVLYIDISEYANSGREILRSEDITLDVLPKELATETELQPFKDKLPELITEFETLMDNSNVDEFISTGRLLGNTDNLASKDDFFRSQPSSARLEFEDLDEIDIDELKVDDILPIKKFENKLFYLKLNNFPVSLNFMEKMNGSLDDDMNSPMPMTELQLLSVLFQVAFGLAVANKHFNFVHNDLHAGNIMFQSTPQKYLYYSIHGNYYRVPTYNKIAKIIDFARATLHINDKWIVSDAFEPDNDAGEQYAMPDANGKYGEITFDQNGNKLPRPNPSFDLALLSTIITNYVRENMSDSNELIDMLDGWATDKYGINHVHSSVDFSLYTNIARDCHNAIPKVVLKHKLFQQFKIPQKQIPKKQFIYKF